MRPDWIYQGMQESSAGISFTPSLLDPALLPTHPKVHSRLWIHWFSSRELLAECAVGQHPSASLRYRHSEREPLISWLNVLFIWAQIASAILMLTVLQISDQVSLCISAPPCTGEEMILVRSSEVMPGIIFTASDECWICIWSGCTGRAGRGYKNAEEYPVHAKVQLHRQAPVFQGTVSHTCNKPQLCSKLMLIWLSGTLVLNVIFSSPSLNSLS